MKNCDLGHSFHNTDRILSIKRMNTLLLENFKAFNSTAYFSFHIYNCWRKTTLILESKTFMGLFVLPQNENSELAGQNRSVSSQDQKFSPTPRTNQIAGFREFRPLTSQE